MKTPIQLILPTLALVAGLQQAVAQGTAFMYQGKFNDGATPATGNYDLRFTIYDSTNLPGVVIAGPMTNAATAISNGLFSVTLDFGTGVFTGPDRFLEIGARTNLGGGGTFLVLSPRQKLTPTPYAITAGNLSGIVPAAGIAGSYSSAVTFNNPLNSFGGDGGGLNNVNAATLGGFNYCNLPCYWNISGNAGTSPGVNFLGTTDNQPLTVKVNNKIALQFIPGATLPNIVGGLAGFRPSVLAGGVSGAVIAGGNAPSGGVTGFGGGDFMAVYDNDGAIGGGFGNKVGSNNGDLTDAAFATVGGGVFNGAAAYAATVGGGDGNLAGGQRSFIGGGFGNQALAGLSVLGGGIQNIILSNSDYSTIGGGDANTIRSNCFTSTIGGGTNNLIDANPLPGFPSIGVTIAGGDHNSVTNSGNTSSPSWATVGGGYRNVSSALTATVAGGGQNICSGWSATIGGGDFNVCDGINSTIPGGTANSAPGYFSFAAGSRANALHQGSFVWSDSQLGTFSSTANNQVSFRCGGGVLFTSGTGGANQTVSWAPGGASWSFSSDRTLKEGIEAVDSAAVLEKVASLPISEWNYKGYAQRHIGVMAQDFHAAFPLNESTTTLNDADLHGVELAAIQGLNRKVEEQTKALETKDARIAELEHRLERLEKMISFSPEKR